VPDRAQGDLARDPGVLILGGATATGKSSLAADLARAVGGAVVSADSRQVYRGLEIGTAQPDERLRALAPHFLIGFLSPAADYSAGRYGADARRVTAALRRRGLPVVLCGGTGLYLRAALGGLFRERARRIGARAVPGSGPLEAVGESVARGERRAALARRWEREGPAALHAELSRIDPPLAHRVQTRDRQRVLRGLAFHAETGERLSASWVPQRAEGRCPSEAAEPDGSRGALRFALTLPVRVLESRIRERLERMLETGLLEEGRSLHGRYAERPPTSLTAVGYPELFRYFEGEASLEEARGRMLVRTRQYAKRQRTWFRNQDGYRSLSAGEEALAIMLDAWRERLA
jgi:tRNA dimethylallyltransferase